MVRVGTRLATIRQVLFLPRVESGRAPIHEKSLRPIAAEIDWGTQREM